MVCDMAVFVIMAINRSKVRSNDVHEIELAHVVVSSDHPELFLAKSAVNRPSDKHQPSGQTVIVYFNDAIHK